MGIFDGIREWHEENKAADLEKIASGEKPSFFASISQAGSVTGALQQQHQYNVAADAAAIQAGDISEASIFAKLGFQHSENVAEDAAKIAAGEKPSFFASISQSGGFFGAIKSRHEANVAEDQRKIAAGEKPSFFAGLRQRVDEAKDKAGKVLIMASIVAAAVVIVIIMVKVKAMKKVKGKIAGK